MNKLTHCLLTLLRKSSSTGMYDKEVILHMASGTLEMPFLQRVNALSLGGFMLDSALMGRIKRRQSIGYHIF